MATTTATILIGRAHQNDSGINPTHFIQFTENDRPTLILQAIEGESKKVVIIPTIENTTIATLFGGEEDLKVNFLKFTEDLKRDILWDLVK